MDKGEKVLGEFYGTAYTMRGDSDQCVCCEGNHIYSRGITFEKDMQHGLQSAILDLFNKHTVDGKRIVIRVVEVEENGKEA